MRKRSSELTGRSPIGYRAFVAGLALAVIVAGAVGEFAASSAAKTRPDATGSQKLIFLELSFPCGLNSYATSVCKGVTAAGKTLGPGYKVAIKTGTSYSDIQGYNSLIQNSEQLHPAGLILFVNGPAAQTPLINGACAKGIKMILIDSPATGVKPGCQKTFVGANHYQLGVDDGKWLIAHPPANGSKQVGVVTLMPGEYASNDARVKGFETTVQKAGFTIAATQVTTNDLPTTAGNVTNMVTAHPNLGAIFSANGPMGDGTAQALKNNHAIVQLSLDGFLNDIPLIKSGEISADAAQDPYREGWDAVEDMTRVLQGKSVPKLTYTPSEVVDKANVGAYAKAGGMH